VTIPVRASARGNVAALALEQRQQQTFFVAEMIFHQRRVDAGLLRNLAQRDLDGIAGDHQRAGREQQLVRSRILADCRTGRDA
jgi:hypothetical protein